MNSTDIPLLFNMFLGLKFLQRCFRFLVWFAWSKQGVGILWLSSFLSFFLFFSHFLVCFFAFFFFLLGTATSCSPPLNTCDFCFLYASAEDYFLPSVGFAHGMLHGVVVWLSVSGLLPPSRPILQASPVSLLYPARINE